METFARLARTIKGARRLEIFIGMAVIAAALLVFTGSSGMNKSTTLESRMERVLSSIDGAGRVSVLINESEEGEVKGVLVVAEGAGELAVRMRLLGAVKATLGTDASRIEIIEMEGSG